MATMTKMQREVKHAIRHRAVTLFELRVVNGFTVVQPTRTYQKGVIVREFDRR